MDLCALPFKLFSFKISTLTPAGSKIYFATTEGDVVEVSLSSKKEVNIKTTHTFKTNVIITFFKSLICLLGTENK